MALYVNTYLSENCNASAMRGLSAAYLKLLLLFSYKRKPMLGFGFMAIHLRLYSLSILSKYPPTHAVLARRTFSSQWILLSTPDHTAEQREVNTAQHMSKIIASTQRFCSPTHLPEGTARGVRPQCGAHCQTWTVEAVTGN